MTGREEHIQKTQNEVAEILKDQPAEVTGFYSSMVHSGRTKSYMTQKQYLLRVIEFLSAVEKPAAEVTYDDIIEYMDLKSYNRNRTRKSGSAMVVIHAALKKFYAYMKKSKRISENPMDEVDRPAPKPSDQVKRVSLTKGEIQQVLDNIRRSGGPNRRRNELIFLLLLSNAMRLNALYELNVQDIDLTANTLKVIEKENKARTFYMSDSVANLMRSWLNERKYFARCDALIIGDDGKRLSRWGIEQVIMKSCEVTGKHITPHKLRATAATLLSEDGYSVYEIQKLLGHASPKTTEIYLQNGDEAARRANIGTAKFYA